MKGRFKYRLMSLKQKIIFIFSIVFIIFSVFITLSSATVFLRIYKDKSKQYIEDITKQTTNNIKNNINHLEQMTFEILDNTTIQNGLDLINKKELSVYEKKKVLKDIEKELIGSALFNKNIISLTVNSLHGDEMTVQKIHGKKIKRMFEEKEIYKAGGSTLWTITDDGENNICIGRAIIGLKSQKPIGYINIICEESYFGEIVEDISGTYYNGTYIVDKKQKVISSNNKRYLGKEFPILIRNILPNSKGLIENIDSIKSYIYIGNDMGNGWSLVTVVPVHEIFKNIKKFTLSSVLISIGAILIAVSIILIIIKKVTKPIQQLGESISAVGKGDFSIRVPVYADDEIGILSKSYNQMADNIENLIEKVYKMEISQKQAEIEFLKMQINPHFLYNTLDTISWMARMEGNEDVSEMILVLSDLLKATIKQKNFITVEEELKSLHNYLFIQEYRFGDKIEIVYEIDEKAKRYIIPNFILQPIIENSIIHGLEPKIDKGHLHIKIKEENQKLKFMIADDGVGMTKTEIEKLDMECEGGDMKDAIGIKNVCRRLKIYYGKEQILKIESGKNKGTKISFSIPISKLEKTETRGYLRENK